jgi:uncharacterized protein YxjI
MKKISILSVLLFLQSHALGAITLEEIPDHFEVHQHWISLTSAFDIKSDKQLIGTLYRKFLSFLLTYEFYDAQETKQAIAKARVLSVSANFEIYDTKDHLLGIARERFFSFFSAFDILGPDNTMQATATMNLWGTEFTIIDPITKQVIGVMTRPFIRFKNDWTINIQNRQLIEEKNIDPNVLLTVLAFQGDQENWKNSKNIKPAYLQKSKLFLNQIDSIAEELGLSVMTDLPKDFPIETFANQLEQDFYQAQGENFTLLSSQEQMQRFETHFSQLLQSDKLNQEEKQALVFLIKNRIE